MVSLLCRVLIGFSGALLFEIQLYDWNDLNLGIVRKVG